MESLYELLIIPSGFFILFILLAFLDSKRNYDNDEFPLILMNCNTGEQYFKINAYKWQYHKIKMIRNHYQQNTKILTPDNFVYRIVSYKGTASIDFFTYEIRFGLEPVTEPNTQVIQNINISITDSANINLKLNNDFDFSLAYSEIHNKIENIHDKNELLSYIEAIYNHDILSKEGTRKFFTLLKKYEWALSCASNLISAISSIISTIR